MQPVAKQAVSQLMRLEHTASIHDVTPFASVNARRYTKLHQRIGVCQVGQPGA